MSCGECTNALSDVSDLKTLWRGIADKRIPVSATLELTYRCNFECVHCYCLVPDRETAREELTAAEWKSFLDEMAAEGGLSVSFTGGDPFLRRDFFEIAEHARARRFVVRILTNASFLTEPIADRVAALKPGSLSISLYGASAETYAAVTGRAHFHGKAVAGIRRLHARGVRLQLKFPLMRENFHDRYAMIDFAHQVGASWRADAEIGPKDDGNVSPLAHALTDEQLEVFVREFTGPLEPTPAFQPGDKLCQPGIASFAVGPYGDVFPCMQIKSSMGNVRRERFASIWESSEALNHVRSLRAGHFEGCNACRHFGPCKPCPGLSLTTTGSLTNPSPTTCRITEHRSRLPILA